MGTVYDKNNFQDSIIGLDTGLADVYKTIRTIAKYNVNVLLLGETGTGKELFAELIHRLSTRKKGPIVKINCASLPDNLLESELFGFEKGAFTGAGGTKKGKIELANNGTLFLDEIGDMKLELQVKLLRVLQTKEISRIGGLNTKMINFRLITATNINLEKAVCENRFREDLFYRISTFPIIIPPLRERQNDISALAEFILKKISRETKLKPRSLTSHTVQTLKKYYWPGNVRELENVLLQALVLAQEIESIDPCLLKGLISRNKKKIYNKAIREIMFVMIRDRIDFRDINRDIVDALMNHFNNNVRVIEQETSLSRDRIYRYRKIMS